MDLKTKAARTVKELKEALDSLPDDMPVGIDDNYSPDIKPLVFHIGGWEDESLNDEELVRHWKELYDRLPGTRLAISHLTNLKKV